MKIKDRVKRVLETMPETRDNDRKLQTLVWISELTEQGFCYWDFFEKYNAGLLSHSESLRQSRQSLQREFTHLQGEKYEKRQAHSITVKKAKQENPGYVPVLN